MGRDRIGFYKPEIDNAKCIDCGKCKQICPFNNPQYKNDAHPKCYAFNGTDEMSLSSATAGGFQALAKDFLVRGGKVVGAAWDDDMAVRHIMVDNLQDLPRLYKSKYVQSFMGDICDLAKAELEKGTPVLFSGVECQIAGLYAALGRDYLNLYTVGLICYCAPSQGLLKWYLDEKFGEGNVTEFDFRAKKKTDEKTRFQLNIRIKLRNERELFLNHYNDDFARLFHGGYLMGEHCENCRVARFPRQADITLGDFHAIEYHDTKFLDFKTEAAIVNNAKGGELVEIIRKSAELFEEKPLEWLWENPDPQKWSNADKPINKVVANCPAHPARSRMEFYSRFMPVSKAAEYVLNNRHEIGVITMIGNRNYGGGLTAFALYKTLLDMGRIPLMIEQPMSSSWRPSGNRNAFYKDPYNPWDVARIYTDLIDMRADLNNRCDMFLVGSDQMFATRGLFEMTDRYSSLCFADDSKHLAGYSCSFGKDFISCDDYERQAMGFFLKKFNCISMREPSGIDLLKREFGVYGAQLVLDPVFLCDRRHFDELAGRGDQSRCEGITAYILDNSHDKDIIISDIQEKLGGLPVHKIGDYYSGDYNTENPSAPKMEDLVTAFCSAKFVVTDSFHGVCFALIYGKPFVVFINEARGKSRFDSMITQFDIGDRFLSSFSDYENISENLTDIDWDLINKKKAVRIEQSMAYLRHAVNWSGIACTKEPKTTMDIFFTFYNQISEIQNQFNYQTQQMSEMQNRIGYLTQQIQETREQTVNYTNQQIQETREQTVNYTNQQIQETREQTVNYTNQQIQETREQVNYQAQQMSELRNQISYQFQEIKHWQEKWTMKNTLRRLAARFIPIRKLRDKIRGQL